MKKCKSAIVPLPHIYSSTHYSCVLWEIEAKPINTVTSSSYHPAQQEITETDGHHHHCHVDGKSLILSTDHTNTVARVLLHSVKDDQWLSSKTRLLYFNSPATVRKRQKLQQHWPNFTKDWFLLAFFYQCSFISWPAFGPTFIKNDLLHTSHFWYF